MKKSIKKHFRTGLEVGLEVGGQFFFDCPVGRKMTFLVMVSNNSDYFSYSFAILFKDLTNFSILIEL